ncbi:hypothetical protein C2W62_13470 [Candidatus Entotheonella serta]|nr:hypothetical protein C2W62_13470 [Candidatus Entotheonella serta]
MNSADTERAFFAPLASQNAVLDPGLATLKCLLLGHGIAIDDGRLADIGATEADGHDLYTLARVAEQLGLAVLPALLPVDHLLLPEAFPTIVTIHPILEELPYPVVVWNRKGPFLQIMDPKLGRRWMTTQALFAELHRESTIISSSDWLATEHDIFCHSLRQRLLALRISSTRATFLMERVTTNAEWRATAHLDAITQMVTSIVRHGAVRRGREAEQLLVQLDEEASSSPSERHRIIPAVHWALRSPVPEGSAPTFRTAVARGDESLTAEEMPISSHEEDPKDTTDAQGSEPIQVDGIVVLRMLESSPVSSRVARASETTAEDAKEEPSPQAEMPLDDAGDSVSSTSETIERPSSSLFHYLCQDGLLKPSIIGFALVLAALSVVFQALLFRGLIDISQRLDSPSQRLWAMAFIVSFALGLLLLKWLSHNAVLNLGHRLDGRLRMAVLSLMPGLSNQYFEQFSAADTIERTHSMREIKSIPFYSAEFLQILGQFCFTIVGMAWIDWLAALLSLCKVALPFAVMNVLGSLAAENLRARTYLAYINRFYFDAMLGLTAVRAHGAEHSMRREYESLMARWGANKLNNAQRQQWITLMIIGLSRVLTALIILLYVIRGKEAANLVLLSYWTLQLENVTNGLVFLLFSIMNQQSIATRIRQLLEAPLEQELMASSDTQPPRSEPEPIASPHGVAITMDHVNVQIAEQTLLHDIHLTIKAGSQVAIVGPSGAGKSTLVGLFMGWHYPLTGQILINGSPLTYTRLQQLRRETAWIDPTVQLWNRSFLYNLRYGGGEAALHLIIDQADLRQVLERMPQGMQTPLGGEGRFVSGGEGQRIRFGRAMQRRAARLVIMDEPFRGLDRDKRCTLLARARAFWPQATLICITHDVSQTQDFERVLVMDEGRLVEDDAPSVLLSRPTSRYRALVEAGLAVRETLWASGAWRRLWLENGQLEETTPTAPVPIRDELISRGNGPESSMNP